MLDSLGPQQWPCPEASAADQARLYADGRFVFADGRARFAAVTPRPQAGVNALTTAAHCTISKQPALAYGRGLLRVGAQPPGLLPARSSQVCTYHEVSEARIR